jgi:hypothetical protein
MTGVIALTILVVVITLVGVVWGGPGSRMNGNVKK